MAGPSALQEPGSLAQVGQRRDSPMPLPVLGQGLPLVLYASRVMNTGMLQQQCAPNTHSAARLHRYLKYLLVRRAAACNCVDVASKERHTVSCVQHLCADAQCRPSADPH